MHKNKGKFSLFYLFNGSRPQEAIYGPCQARRIWKDDAPNLSTSGVCVREGKGGGEVESTEIVHADIKSNVLIPQQLMPLR